MLESKSITFEIYDVQVPQEGDNQASIFVGESPRFDTTVAEEMDDADKNNLKPIGIVTVNIDEILQFNWLESELEDMSDVEYQVTKDVQKFKNNEELLNNSQNMGGVATPTTDRSQAMQEVQEN